MNRDNDNYMILTTLEKVLTTSRDAEIALQESWAKEAAQNAQDECDRAAKQARHFSSAEAVMRAVKMGQILGRLQKNMKTFLPPGFDQVFPSPWDAAEAGWLDIQSQKHLYR